LNDLKTNLDLDGGTVYGNVYLNVNQVGSAAITKYSYDVSRIIAGKLQIDFKSGSATDLTYTTVYQITVPDVDFFKLVTRTTNTSTGATTPFVGYTQQFETVDQQYSGSTGNSGNNSNGNTGWDGGYNYVAAPFLDKVNHLPYIKGYADNTVRADNEITRAEVSEIIYRLIANKDGKRYSAPYSDIDNGAWYSEAVGYLAQYKVVNGYPDGQFLPNAAITRAEIAVIVSRFETLIGGNSGLFTDVNNEHWAYVFIESAAQRGWIKGYGDGTFAPNANATRAEFVSLVNRALERNPESVPANALSFSDFSSSHWAYKDIAEATQTHTYTRDDARVERWQ
jgi:hypothetical protein